MAGQRIYGDLIVDGALTFAGDVTLGKTTTTGTERAVTLAGTETNITYDIVPKGAGLVRVPSGYEANIASEGRALVNKAYHDVNIAGLSTAITAPGADSVMFYDHSELAINWLEFDSSLGITGTTLSVQANTTVQKIAARLNTTGGDVATRRRINFIEGSNITITVADNSGDDELNVTIDAAAVSPTVGTAREIPFINTGATDFAYSTGVFEWTDAKRTLLGGATLTFASPSNGYSVAIGQDMNVSGDWSWSALFGDVHVISASFNNNLLSGTGHTITTSPVFNTSIAGDAHSLTGNGWKGRDLIGGSALTYNVTTTGLGNASGYSIAYGQFNTISGTIVRWGHVGGRLGQITADGAFVHAYPISLQSTRAIIASGIHAVNISANSSSQTSGHGALANYCAIVGGQDSNIPSDSTHAVILGGNAIKARAATPNEVYVTGLTLAAGAVTGLNVSAPAALTDAFRMYGTDITAGNSAPHFKTENGDVVKLYADSGWTKMTGTPEKGTFATSTVTLAQLAGKVMALEAVLFDNIGFLKA